MLLNKPKLHRDWIDKSAYSIVERLQKAGFETYLVGGCVRDLLAGIHPKDYDIATSALPEQVRRKISNSYVIGRRFKLVLVKRGETQYEVATFRRNVKDEDLTEEHPISGDNFFGTAEEDARRRDFTLNSLFYDPVKDQLIDHCSGVQDIEKRIIRVIGDPVERFNEDPIRILRAIRLSHKLEFSLDPALLAGAVTSAEFLKNSVLPRRREEYIKIMRLKSPWLVWRELFDLGILKFILPQLHQIYLDHETAHRFEDMLIRLKSYAPEWKEPAELFSILLFSYFYAMDKNFSDSNFEQKLSEDTVFDRWAREEFGIFKIEISFFLQSMHLKNLLLNKDLYLRRGYRRKKAFVAHSFFPLSLVFGFEEGSMNISDFSFWEREFSTLSQREEQQ